MGCMKCGRDTPEDQAFCDACREDMAKYPVKPNIVVQLPQRKEGPAVKRTAAPRRRAPTPEEVIRRLRRRVRIFVALWLVTLALLAATIYPAAQYLFGDAIYKIGQNYSTFTETEPSTPAETVSRETVQQ